MTETSRVGNLLVFLIVVTLLFCHGAFGYAHQLTPADAHAAHVAQMESGHQSGPGQSTDETHSGGAYFATLLALFFGTFLLLGGRIPASTRLPAPVAEHRGRWAKILLPPRGPTLPSLQVFRL